MVIKTVGKYMRIYRTLLKFSFIQATAYPISFLIELLVEFGYQPIAIIFFKIMYSNVEEIAGWNYYEVLFLVGMIIVVAELFLGLVYIWNLREIPLKIRRGDVDLVLLQPINSMFNLTLGRPYFTSVFSTISGFYIMTYAFIQLGRPFSILNLLFGLLILAAGVVMCYSFGVILTSFAFKLQSAYALPYISERIFIYFAENPHHVYKGLFRILFFYIIPVVFVISIPSTTIMRGIEWNYVWQSIVLATIFLFVAIKTWNHMLKSYSSASS
jgi:ABC-2 type transport system permease protein